MSFPLHKRSASTPGSTTPIQDVVKELFGTQKPFSELLIALDPHVDAILWKVIDHIGVDDFRQIKAAKRPARELVLYLRAHAENLDLSQAFRDAVSVHDALRQLVLSAQSPPETGGRPAPRRQSTLPQAPTSEVLLQSRELLKAPVERNKTRTLPFPEIKHPSQWEREVLSVMKDGAAPLVVTFFDAQALLPEGFVAEMSRLAQECKPNGDSPRKARFMKATIAAVRTRAESIIDDPITANPTTLIILANGFRRVDGDNIRRVRKSLFGRQGTASSTAESAASATGQSPPISPPIPISSAVLTAEPGEMDSAKKEAEAPAAVQPESAPPAPEQASAVPHFIVPLHREDRFLDPALVMKWVSAAVN